MNDRSIDSGERVASPIEQQFWLLHQQGKKTAYNVVCAFKIVNADLKKLLHSIDVVLRKYSVFQSRYSLGSGVVYASTCTQDISPKKVTFTLGSNGLEPAYTWLTKQSQKPFDLEGGPPVRILVADILDTSTFLLSLVFHHAVIDLRTKDLIASEISALYDGGDAASEIIAYRDCFTPEYQSSELWKRARVYWQDVLKGVNRGVSISHDDAEVNEEPLYIDLDVGERLWKELRGFAQKNNSAPYIVLLAAYFYVLTKYTGQSDFCIAIPLSNRKVEGFKNTRGCFVNTIPLRLSLNNGDSFYSLVARVRKALLGAHRFQDLPYLMIVDEANQVSHSALPLFNFGFTFEHPMSLELSGAKVDVLEIPNDQTQLPLFLRSWVEGEALHARLEMEGRFNKRFAESFSESLKEFLKNAICCSHLPIDSIPIICRPDSELINKVNATEVSFDSSATLKSLFEKQVKNKPHNIALVMQGNQVTYEELNNRANQLAHCLIQEGVYSGAVVGVALERSIGMVEVIYALVKIGVTYLPLDIELPKERIDFMLNQSNACAVITHLDWQQKEKASATKVFNLEKLYRNAIDKQVSNPVLEVAPESPAYLIYTSGSTGLPKGVLNSHIGICNRLFWKQSYFQLDESDVVLHKTPTSFDVSVWELFWPLQVGAKIAIADHNSHKDPSQIDRQILAYGVSVVHFVPSVLASLLSAKPSCTHSPTLRQVICSGEELGVGLQDRFFQNFENVELFNLYGPTEAAIDVTYWHCRLGVSRGRVPIGVPVANTKIHILDQSSQLAPVGVAGELCIAGPQVALGYVNNVEQTDQVFVANPYGEGRIYKTGDLARWNEKGQIEYLGRRDFQVKLNGVRIELMEIESLASSLKGIKQVVVLAYPKKEPQFLVFFYSCQNKKDVSEQNVIKQFLLNKLPDYMVPKQYIYVTDFKLSASGKVNREALFEIFEKSTVNAVSHEEETELEYEISNVWAEVIGRNSIPLDEPFFEAGGNSLALASVFSKLKDRVHGDLQMVDLYAHPTIRAIASFIRGKKDATTSKRHLQRRAEKARGFNQASHVRRRRN